MALASHNDVLKAIARMRAFEKRLELLEAEVSALNTRIGKQYDAMRKESQAIQKLLKEKEVDATSEKKTKSTRRKKSDDATES